VNLVTINYTNYYLEGKNSNNIKIIGKQGLISVIKKKPIYKLGYYKFTNGGN